VPHADPEGSGERDGVRGSQGLRPINTRLTEVRARL
jgi:hypothetical protein